MPRDATEVGRLFATARRAGVPLTFRSGGTSLSGQAVTGGILADTRRHFRRVEVLDDGARVRVGPGATIRQVNARLAAHGRKLGPDPASEGACTLGGVVANNSSGMACGTVANSYATLDSLTLVLPVRHGRRHRCSRRRRPARGPRTRAARRAGPHPRPAPRRRHPARHDRAAVRDEEHHGLRAQLVPRPHPPRRRARPPRGGQRGHARVHRRDRHAHGAAAAPRPHRAARVRRPQRRDRRPARARRHRSGHHRAARRHVAARGPDRPAGRRPAARPFRRRAGRTARRVPGRDRRRGRRARRRRRVACSRACPSPGRARSPPTRWRRAALWHIRKGLYAAVAGARPSGTTALLEDVVVPVPALLPTCERLTTLFDTPRLRRRRDLRARQGRQHPLHAHRAAVRRLARPVLPLHRGHGRS